MLDLSDLFLFHSLIKISRHLDPNTLFSKYTHVRIRGPVLMNCLLINQSINYLSYNRIIYVLYTFISLALWPHSHLMLSGDVSQASEHAKPSGKTGSQMQLPEHTFFFYR